LVLAFGELGLFCINRAGYLMLDTRFSMLSRCGGIGFVWSFDFAQGRAELEFLAGIGIVWVCFFDWGEGEYWRKSLR